MDVCGFPGPAPGTTLLWPSPVGGISPTIEGGNLSSKWHFVNKQTNKQNPQKPKSPKNQTASYAFVTFPLMKKRLL